MTGIQEAAAIAGIVNGGVYNPPTVIKRATDAQGTRSPSTAGPTAPDHLREGLGPGARPDAGRGRHRQRPEEPAAGRLPDRRQDRHRRSGPTPSAAATRATSPPTSASPRCDDPQMLTYVVINNPRKGDTGTRSPAPVYRDIMNLALPRYSVPPNAKKHGAAADRVVSRGDRSRVDASAVAVGHVARGPVCEPRRPAAGRRSCRPASGRCRSPGSPCDSRLVGPGDLYVALPGTRHHGAEFAGEPPTRRRGRGAHRPGRAPAARPARCRSPVVVVADPRAAMAGRGRADLRPAGRGDDHVRGHRHQRQDHHHLPARRRAARAGSPHRPDRHHRLPARRRDRWRPPGPR